MLRRCTLILLCLTLLGSGLANAETGISIFPTQGEERVALAGDTLCLVRETIREFDLAEEKLSLTIVETGVFPIQLGGFSALVSVPDLAELFDFPLHALAAGEDYSGRLFFIYRCICSNPGSSELKTLGLGTETAVLLDLWDSYYLWAEGLSGEPGECFALLIEPRGAGQGELQFFVRQIIPVADPQPASSLVLAGAVPRRLRVGDLVFIPLYQTRSAQTYYELEDDLLEVVRAREDAPFADESVLLRAVKPGVASVTTFFDHWQRPVLKSSHRFEIAE